VDLRPAVLFGEGRIGAQAEAAGQAGGGEDTHAPVRQGGYLAGDGFIVALRMGGDVEARAKMTVMQLIVSAFKLSTSRHQGLRSTWTHISFRVGSQLPNSLLLTSIQRIGDLDILLRCAEDDFSPSAEDASVSDIFLFHYQKMFSEIWASAAYEIFRLLKARNLADEDCAFASLAHDLRLLRIPLEKHEIAADSNLSEPLLMQRMPPNNDETDRFRYAKNDALKAHIMPTGISCRGSVMWEVIDVKANKSYWIERRQLSERMVKLWKPDSDEKPSIDNPES